MSKVDERITDASVIESDPQHPAEVQWEKLQFSPSININIRVQYFTNMFIVHRMRIENMLSMFYRVANAKLEGISTGKLSWKVFQVA